MRYVEARVEENNRDEAYRIFVTRSLQLIPQSKYLTTDFNDIIHPDEKDNRTADEIASDVIKNAGLTLGK